MMVELQDEKDSLVDGDRWSDRRSNQGVRLEERDELDSF